MNLKARFVRVKCKLTLRFVVRECVESPFCVGIPFVFFSVRRGPLWCAVSVGVFGLIHSHTRTHERVYVYTRAPHVEVTAAAAAAVTSTC